MRGRPGLRLAIMHSPLVSLVVVVICPSSLYRTIKIWDLAAALDAGSASDAICITTLKVGDLRVVLYLRVGEVIFVGISVCFHIAERVAVPFSALYLWPSFAPRPSLPRFHLREN